MDFIVDKANELGMFVGLLPTWGRYWHDNFSENGNKPLFTVENAEKYGEFIGQRYKDKHVIWILGGDRNIQSETQKNVIRAMAKGIRKWCGDRQLISFHPTGQSGSSQWFHNDEWLDFNMRQNGHTVDYTDVYSKTLDDYNLLPVKPVVDGEPLYEDHPISFNPQKLGHSVSADIRRTMYWDLFNGTCGYTYGHHSIWQMYDTKKGRNPINNPLMTWKEALDQPGASQVVYGKKLIESRPFFSRIPDSSIIVTDKVATSVPGEGRYRFVATRDEEGTYAMIYVPVGRAFKVNLNVIKGEKIKAWWYNPRNGRATKIGTFVNDKNKRSAAYKNISIMPWSVIFANYNSQIYKDIRGIIFRTSAIGPFFIILACFVVALYIKTITKPLISLVSFAKEISQGNLVYEHQNINRDDELGMLANSFFNMRDVLLDIIMKVRVSADEITNSARALSKDSEDLSRRTDTQASSLQETASSMEEMASTIVSSTNKSVDGNKMMINSKASIEHAGSIILDTVQNIEEVNEASTKIKNITKIIEDIAFQTNILALNAAVEAARAGDQGKGFAVVASEVRNLAQTTQSSVKDITSLADNAYEKITKATESARESQEIFKDIQDKIDVTSKLMDDISTTALEQQAGVQQVNKAITDMDAVTQQNAALVEHTSASSSSLLNQAEELVNAMSFFKV